jgi:hypothetical protein
MITKLEIENFYSYKDKQTVDLRISAKLAPDDRLAPAWKGSNDYIPKVVAFFGANASGKSNTLKALPFLSWFICHSFAKPADQPLPFERFSTMLSQSSPTRLAIELGGIEDFNQLENPDALQCKYLYELILKGEAGVPSKVISESLHYWPSHTSRITRIFERDEVGNIAASPVFELAGLNALLKKILRPDASIISTLKQLQHKPAEAIWSTANLLRSNILMTKMENSDETIVQHYASSNHHLAAINHEIQRFDLGIEAMNVARSERGPYLEFRHAGLDMNVPQFLESHGTWQFIKFFPILKTVLQQGGVAVLDELDIAIHPALLPEIIGWFHDPTNNPHNAQLWISAQNVSLLDYLIKEEVFFCEKNTGGVSTVYGLKDIKGTRRGDNFYKKYLSGLYGALPQVG